ncbi:hypothetical protein M0812_28479 [Anaeramoeba flamelloides]|uniref:BTB domain-containing protein n=1 Tax=Anaeramoeba flamelloides TaxID=1746091 RepID=A0AAV7YDN5_9EUKA|nr:hypothetical protein M0812_28479 [Anaeramoeba flamelloides]
MSKSSSLYLCGLKKDFSFLVTQEENNNLPKWTENIVSSQDTYQILTESGKVWSLAGFNHHKEVPLVDADQSTFEEIRPVTFFEEKKLFVNSLIMGSCSCYYLCNGDQLYASGSNHHGSLGTGKKGGEKEPMPVYVQDKVTKIFGGVCALNFFFVTSKPDLLYGCGNNISGELGIGSDDDPYKPTVVKNFKGSEILTISSCVFYSILITKKGQTFSCCFKKFNGHGVPKTIFTLIPQLKEKKAVQLATGSNRNLILTDQNELYGWGFDDFFPTNKPNNNNNHNIPTKISLPGFFTNYLGSKDMIRIACGSKFCFIYLDFKNTLPQDLRLLFESKKFCDCEIGTLGNQIPVHKSLVECRTKLTFDQIQNKLFVEKSINKEQTLNFLKWIYYDEISDLEKLEQTFNLLELTYPPSVDNTLEKDIAQLYKDDDSKDFKILVKIEDDDDQEDNEDEDEEGNYEEIPVHKFILYSRSGLFRAMFDYVNKKDNTNKVQDYTNKSIKSLKILVKYFYTNSIELTANQEPKLIVDELSDAVEYYQLNDQCNFESELMKIKKQFDLN